MSFALRPYQTEAVDALFGAWANGYRALVELPTGSGKSAVQGEIARRLVGDGKRVMFLAHRKELIEQNVATLLRFGIHAGVWSASLGKKQLRDVSVVQIQSTKALRNARFDCVVIDEAHLVPTSRTSIYQRMIENLMLANPDVKIGGMTATPYRLDSGLLTVGSDKPFDLICYKAPFGELVDGGFLAPLTTSRTSAQINLDGVHVTRSVNGPEYDARELEMSANIEAVTQAVVSDVGDALRTRQAALVYCVSVKHAHDMCAAMNAAGITCAVVTGETEGRGRIIERFRRREIQAIASCDVLTTGFDVPHVDVIAIVRATMSMALYVQICGRGTRIADGKGDCLVLDYGGNIFRHGPIDDLRIKAKRQSTSKDKQQMPMKVCEQCGLENAISARMCVGCDFEFPAPEKKASETASTLPIMKTKGGIYFSKKGEPLGKEISSRTVTHVAAYRHEKPGNTPTARIEYAQGSGFSHKVIAREWICPEHDEGTIPKIKFLRFMHDVRSDLGFDFEFPSTVDETVKFFDAKFFTCSHIALKVDGQWPTVLERKWVETPQEMEAAQ